MRTRRLVGAGLALSLSGIALVGGGQAWGASGPKGKVTCTGMNGTVTGTVTVSGCVGTANTGGGSQPLPVATLAAGGMVTWLSAKTTTFSAAAVVSTPAKKCPGYVKPAKHAPPPPNNPTAIKFSGTVTADNSGMKLPGKFKGAVCIASDGTITALKALKVN